MSLHRSLKTKPAGLNQHRNVLTRDERVARLMNEGDFDPEADSPIGMRKVGNRAMVTKKPKKEAAEEGDVAEGVAEAEAAAE
ncbi:MAG: small basic protein [Phycisphaerales bacterium]|jgi:small basic protein (TIGR04137 family)|nr:small basic protein [Phycisphaerales bacterium]